MADDDRGEDEGADGNPDPFRSFAANPLFKAMMGALSGQGPLNWDVARQIAVLGAVGERDDGQPDPRERWEVNDLARIAAMHVAGSLGRTDVPTIEFLTVSRAAWAERTLTDFRPLFTDLATSLTRTPADDPVEAGDPLASMFGEITAMIAPAMVGMAIGAMVGAMAQRAFGQYDLPLPRAGSREMLVVPANVRGFADDWSLAEADVRMWVLIHEIASHVVLSTDAVDEGVASLVRRHVAAFRPDPSAILDRLGSFDPGDESSLARIEQTFADPTFLLGAVRSPEQERMTPLIDARIAGLLALVDAIVDDAASRLLGPRHTIAEAVRRRRLDTGTDTVVLERLLGLNLSVDQLRRGAEFSRGVAERTDGPVARVLMRMTDDVECLPTPNEIVAPGLWLARLGLDD